MKRLLLVLILFAVNASAQEATVPAPSPRPAIAKYKVDGFSISRQPPSAAINLVGQDSANNDITTGGVNIDQGSYGGCNAVPSPVPTVAGLTSAMANAAPSETGSDSRKMNYRVLYYLVTTTHCITGVTLVP